MINSPFGRYTDDEVRSILAAAGLPPDLTPDNCARVGLKRIRPTQRESVLALYRELGDVNAVFACLGGEVPKSSIRAHLSRATDAGLISRDWAVRRRRSRGRP